MASEICTVQLPHTYTTVTVEPPIKDPLSKGQPPNNGHIAWHQTFGCSVI